MRQKLALIIVLALIALSAGAAALGIAEQPVETTPGPAVAVPAEQPTVTVGSEVPHVPLSPVCGTVEKGGLLALTTRGTVVAVNSRTDEVEGVLGSAAAPREGLALDARLRDVYVTGRGADGFPAVWSLACGRSPVMVLGDAELPAVSPDGGSLAYVALNGDGEQIGVGIVSLAADGRTTGRTHLLAAASVPPPLPIEQIALGPRATMLAVWGGFVDPYLGTRMVTTGTLDPQTARSLRALHAIFDGEGISGPGFQHALPKVRQRAAVYLPNGELLVGGGETGISMPFTDRTPGTSGGGIRAIVESTGPVSSVATGPAGAVAWVTSAGRLSLTTAAWNLPFGPQAQTEPYTPPPARTVPGSYTSVAWTAGTSKAATTLPPVYHVVNLPNVVGLPEPEAVGALDALAIPSFVGSVTSDPAVPPDTVLSQDPPAGVVMACQCSVTLNVSSGGTPVNASLPTNS